MDRRQISQKYGNRITHRCARFRVNVSHIVRLIWCVGRIEIILNVKNNT